MNCAEGVSKPPSKRGPNSSSLGENRRSDSLSLHKNSLMEEQQAGIPPSKTQRMLGGLRCWASRAIRGPSLSHSILFGAAAGIGSYASYYLYRFVCLTTADSTHYAIASRWRYMEKQNLFFKELDETLAAGALGALVKEYDPVATRLPFKPLSVSSVVAFDYESSSLPVTVSLSRLAEWCNPIPHIHSFILFVAFCLLDVCLAIRPGPSLSCLISVILIPMLLGDRAVAGFLYPCTVLASPASHVPALLCFCRYSLMDMRPMDAGGFSNSPIETRGLHENVGFLGYRYGDDPQNFRLGL
ncbi:transmembrane protein [Cyclospora cayetanensis]|uniref:Transmembrane protein n=1 Tax=Cyclospora cayetanensis TaxID=88456 RepID=A0A1D3D7E1_9EIME|nr:transmembrane protein [Cyclospora cayetanensis]